MRMITIIVMIILMCNFLHEPAFTQEENAVVLETQAAHVEVQLAELLKSRRILELHSDSLAGEVTELKGKSGSGLGILSRYRLGSKLKESQELSRELQACETEIAKSREQYRKLAIKLDIIYSEEINAFLKKIDKKQTSDLADSLQVLYAKRNKWREKVPERSSSALILFEVILDSLDGPREIREKADLLKDMEEEIRTKLTLLKKRESDLKEEKKIREKMGDFLEEIALFGDRERGRTDELETQKNVPGAVDFIIDRSSGQGFLNEETSSQTVTRDQVFRFWETVETLDPTNISSHNIDQLIEQYANIIEHLIQRANELNEKAQIFYRQAEAFSK